MSQPPTIAQLRNLADRAATGLTPGEQARLRDGIDRLAHAADPDLRRQLDAAITALGKSETALAALRAVARGYCPDCGRGDAAPTAADWETQRRRADTAEWRHKDAERRVRLQRERAETAEAAVDRAREAAAHYLHEYEDGEDPCAAAVLAALDQTRETT